MYSAASRDWSCQLAPVVRQIGENFLEAELEFHKIDRVTPHCTDSSVGHSSDGQDAQALDVPPGAVML
jgi:hypothetical protein